MKKALEQICNRLMEKGVSKQDLKDYSELAGYGGIPGTFGYKVGRVINGVIVLGLGALGAYIGHKINSPSFGPEIIGGLAGLCVGLNGLVCENGDNIPLITSLVKNHPNKLREVYQENGYPDEEINEIFSFDFVQELQDITYGNEG